MKVERMTRSEIIFKVISYTLIAMFTLICLYPILYAVSASLSGKIAYESSQVILFPVDIQLDAYKWVLQDSQFWISYTNTLFYTVFGTAWSMFVSLAGAYALSKRKLLFRKQFNFLLVFTMWFSAGMIPLWLNYTSMNVDNRYGMIFAFGIQAFNVILLRNYFESVPSEIEEAAMIDGANEFQIFTKIYIPLSQASIATVTLFYAITRWNSYYWASVFLGTKDQPLQVYLRSLIDRFSGGGDSSGGSATGLTYAYDSLVYAIIVCSIIPVLVIYPYIQKYFARGVNVGGVKG